MMVSARRGYRMALGVVWGFILGLGLLPLMSKPALAGLNDCHTNTSAVERQLHIPNGLLLAISLVETGMDGVPQPNALSFGFRSVVAHSRQEAVLRLRGGNGQGKSDAFVGCMQLSVHHHKAEFNSFDRMMDPQSNILYAGRYLVRLHSQSGSWSRAVARYQGGSKHQAQAYVCRVWNHLAELDWNSSKILGSRRCGEMTPPEIAPKTRRAAVRRAQVASAPE